MKKKILYFFVFLFATTAALFFFYFNNENLVNNKTRTFYNQLKDTLNKRNFSANLLVISTKRTNWHNTFQVKTSGAAKESKHLTGDALDFIVFDINKDGTSDTKDVDIVFKILDREIICNKGGIGTYKTEKSFINKQMIHIDCRGYRARWNR